MEKTRFALAMALACGCTQPKAYFSEAPIPLALAGAGGGLLGQGTALQVDTPFPMLVDTGSPISAFSDGSSTVTAQRGSMSLYSAGSVSVPRLQIDDIQLFITPFNASGFDAPTPIHGVLGGDNLQHFVLGMRYTPTPTLDITNQLIPSECDLSQDCATVLPYSIDGGHQLIDLAGDVFNYAASYVILDGCLEPALDPLEPDLNCASIAACEGIAQSCLGIADPVAQEACDVVGANCLADAPRYMPQGVDIRLAVSTGFPGLAITASAYDRLARTGPGAGEALIAAAAHMLYLPDLSSGLAVGVDNIGIPAQSVHDGAARAGLTLVQNDGFFGACASVARSRRLRRVRPEPEFQPFYPTTEASCLRFPPDRKPGDPRNDVLDELLLNCQSNAGTSGDCDDRSQDAHTNAYIDFNGPIPIIIVPDTTSLIQSINADVRPQSATVEAVIGTELLKRAFTTIDYANSRVVMTCADDTCRVFPRQGHGTNCSPPVGDEVFGGGTVRSVAGTGCAVIAPTQ